MISSTSTVLIPYVAPKTPMEFIASEVWKGVTNGNLSIELIQPKFDSADVQTRIAHVVESHQLSLQGITLSLRLSF